MIWFFLERVGAEAGSPFFKETEAQSREPVKKGTDSKTLADSTIGGVNNIVSPNAK